MNIAYLTHDTPDVFYRVGQYLDYLHSNDLSTSILRTPNDFYKRFHTFKALSHYDVVVIQRKLFNAFWRSLLKKYARSLIYNGPRFSDSSVRMMTERERGVLVERLKRI
jgi:hypothetical protein